MRGLRGVSLCILLSTGCALTFDGERKVTRRPQPTPARVRADALPGTAALQPDGTVKFQLALDQLCQRDKITIEEIGVDRRKRYSTAGVVTTVATLALIPLGVFLFSQMETDTDGFLTDDSVPKMIGGILSILGGAVGGGFLLAFRYAEPSGFPKTKGYQKLEERSVPGGSELLACTDGAAAAGELALATPWGTSATAKPAFDGATTFAVDWGAERAGALPREQLASGWRVTAGATAAAWVPSDAEVTQIAQQIVQARERVVVGATPAQLAPALEAKGIEIGGGGQLVVTVRNTGGSTASSVTAKTRSSVAALHGLTLAFGTIQPGANVTRSIDVKIGADVVEDAATVLVVVTDAKGVTAEVTQKLTLTRALCVGGKLTRAQYDEKRAKLKKTLAEKLITQEEFERLDAELLRCLE